jgi:menaquinone-dependent protoporphyrinogen oxidase
MSVLVAYEGKHGSTQEIATRIADRLRARGAHVDLGHASEIKDVTGYQGVVVGSAVYFSSWVKDATEFVRKHETALSERPTWLFSSGPVADAVLPGPKELPALEATIHPRNHRIFSGAIDPKKLSFRERLAVKAVKAPPGDFRDWAEIDAWADSIAEDLAAARLAAPSCVREVA